MGQIEYLVVSQGQQARDGAVGSREVQFRKRTATLSIPQEKYMAIPTYTVQTYPAWYTPTYRTTTYRYFGLTPRERRIINRQP